MKNKSLILVALTSIILLLIPLVAMQLSEEVNWNIFDFLVAGSLLISTGLIVMQLLKRSRVKMYRYIAIFAVILAFILIWLELAVGILGTPLTGN